MPESQVKDIIVEAATKYFSKFGFYKTTMDEIAKHIHKAKGVLYYYFKSKEDLFHEVLRKEMDSIKSELSQAVKNQTDPLTMLEAYFLYRLKLLNKATHYHETLKADFSEKYHFVADIRTDFTNYERNQLTIILQRGKEERYIDITNIDSTVNVMIMIVNGIEIPLYLQNKYEEFEDVFKELTALIIQGLKTRQ